MSGAAHLRDVTTSDIKREAPMRGSSPLEFEAVYRENIGPVTAVFARRCRDPQQVADMTSQTFVEAIKSARTFQGRGSPTAWLIAIARRVYANHLNDQAIGADLIDQLGRQANCGAARGRRGLLRPECADSGAAAEAD
jgi:DNA-directed RNA polymerase specialized sigma24 family protein